MIIRFDFDSDKLGKVFSAIAQSKPSPEIKVEFTVKDKEAVKKSLLAASAKDAKEKADILCQAMNVKLGQLLTINYNWDDLHIYSPTRYSVDDGMICASPCMITTGLNFTPDDIRVKDDASFVWEITE